MEHQHTRLDYNNLEKMSQMWKLNVLAVKQTIVFPFFTIVPFRSVIPFCLIVPSRSVFPFCLIVPSRSVFPSSPVVLSCRITENPSLILPEPPTLTLTLTKH